MADAKLHTYPHFFKIVSIEAGQLKLIADYLQIFIDRAKVRGLRTGDAQLLLILNQAESFLSAIDACSTRLENLCEGL